MLRVIHVQRIAMSVYKVACEVFTVVFGVFVLGYSKTTESMLIWTLMRCWLKSAISEMDSC